MDTENKLKKTDDFYERFDLELFASCCVWCNFYFYVQQFVKYHFGSFYPFRTKCHKFIDNRNPWNQWVWACFGSFSLLAFVKIDGGFCAIFSVKYYDLCRKNAM